MQADPPELPVVVGKTILAFYYNEVVGRKHYDQSVTVCPSLIVY